MLVVDVVKDKVSDITRRRGSVREEIRGWGWGNLYPGGKPWGARGRKMIWVKVW